MDILVAAIIITIFGCIMQNGIFDVFKVPLVVCPIVGALLGDLNLGIIMGAEMQLIFMGAVPIGASTPPNSTIGSIVATALMILSGQSKETALALAVPVAVAGQSLLILIPFINGFLHHFEDRLINKGKLYGVDLCNWLGLVNRMVSHAFLFFPVIFFGSTAIQSVMDSIPQFVLHGLEVAGGMLPLVGFGMLLKYLNIKHLFPYYFIGFGLSTFADVSMIGTTVFAICIATILDYRTNLFTNGGKIKSSQPANIQTDTITIDDLDALMEDDDQNNLSNNLENTTIIDQSNTIPDNKTNTEIATTSIPDDNNKIVTKKDLIRSFFRSFLLQTCWNYERMQGLGFCYCVYPILKKLYKNDPDKLKAAIQRHGEFFNTNPIVSDFIIGTTIAMEENVAKNGAVDTNSINTIKISLMGPLAGIGDSLFYFTIVPISQGIGISLAQNGSLIGPLLYLAIVMTLQMIIRWIGIDQGYKLGVGFVEKLSSGIMQRVTSYATIVGMMVIGVMTATMVKVPLTLKIGVGDSAKTLLEILDSFMPNILPLAFTLLAFWLILKGVSPTKILFGVMALCVLGAWVGVF